jgi:hypothetical protein
MKRFLLICGLTLIFIGAKSQNYTPFNFDSGVWVCRYDVKVSLFGGPYCGEQIDSVMFYCNGDTVINDTVFKKLYYKGYTTCPSRSYISGSYGAIRNDTITKKVWWNVGENYLIYDFDINVGDSVCSTTVFLPISFDFCGIVLSIDSVMLCNRYFKRFNAIDYMNNVHSIIEGIGSPNGLFTTSTWFSDLVCYSEANNNSCPLCEPFLAVQNNSVNQTTVNVNQENDQVFVTSDEIISYLEIVDIAGKKVCSINNINDRKASAVIFQKGVFILKVGIGNKIIVKKIVKS